MPSQIMKRKEYIKRNCKNYSVYDLARIMRYQSYYTRVVQGEQLAEKVDQYWATADRDQSHPLFEG